MIVHPALAKARFTHAMSPLIEHPETFARLGVHLIDCAFPYLYVDLEMRARHQRIRLRVDGSNYDYRPLDGRWVDGEHQILLMGQGRIPSGNGFQPSPMEGC